MWSNPGLATEEHGKLLFETSTKSVIENFKKFIEQEIEIKERIVAKN